MIKIELSADKKSKIEEIFLNEVFQHKNQNKKTILKRLQEDNNRTFLKNEFFQLYQFLFPDESLHTDNVKKLLLAGKNELAHYISMFGNTNIKISQQLLQIFDYKKFAGSKAAYALLLVMDIKTCPYCNRAYIATLQNSSVKPQFDHYYPKSRYPYLALSLYNLIPCCSVCNLAKRDMDTKTRPILYPYAEEFGEKITFSASLKNTDEFVKFARGISDNFDVVINNPENILCEQVHNQDESLHISELYNEHKDYIMDIFKKYYLYSASRKRELLNCMPDLFHSEEDLWSVIFMNYLSKDCWGKRPLAKLTHDIYKELEMLDKS